MNIIQQMDRDTINRLRMENEVLRAGYLNADMSEVEQIARDTRCDYIPDINVHVADSGERLCDILKSKAQRLGKRYVEEMEDTQKTKDVMQKYRRYFNPDYTEYSEDPNSECYLKRVQCHAEDSTAALNLLNEFQEKRSKRGVIQYN